MSNGPYILLKEVLQANFYEDLSEELANDPSRRLTLTVKSSISTHKPGKIHNNDKGYS